MMSTTRKYFLGGFALAASSLVCSVVSAAAIPYGNVSTSKVDFLSVVESSGTDTIPLYGPPSGFEVGLDFDPTSFVASSAGGGGDVTDGQLNFIIDGKSAGPGQVWGFTSLAISEFGDYSLVGTGTSVTKVIGGANVFVTVHEINGLPVAPFTVNASNSFQYDLASNGGLLKPWNNSVLLDLGPSLQAGQAVTKAEVVLNNQLNAISEAGSAAFLAKKDFRVIIPDDSLEPVDVVPEPASAALLGLAVCGLACRRKLA